MQVTVYKRSIFQVEWLIATLIASQFVMSDTCYKLLHVQLNEDLSLISTGKVSYSPAFHQVPHPRTILRPPPTPKIRSLESTMLVFQQA